MALPTRDYGFPFTPYAIQEDFMKALYDVLDQGKVGIFESPTGTVRNVSAVFVSLRHQECSTNRCVNYRENR
jgi:Rad3-related DNA helicase